MSTELEKQVAELQEKMNQMQPSANDKISMIVFSGDLDKLLASFIIATGAVAMGMQVVMFFTFWGTPALRAPQKKVRDKEINLLPYHKTGNGKVARLYPGFEAPDIEQTDYARIESIKNVFLKNHLNAKIGS